MDSYAANITTANDYYPFGMTMPSRNFTATNAYRYGFNGKENDNDVKGNGNHQDHGNRIYDPRLGRFLSVDPITKSYPQLSPFSFASNKPINGIDLDGLEWVLKIYDPQAISDFVKAGNDKDIYKQRGIAYQAIHSKFSAEDFWNRATKNPGIVSEANYNPKTNTFAGGDFKYDKNAPSGVTFKYRTESKGSITENTVNWKRGDGSYYDDNYPVDVRTVNSPEHKDFYGSYDFVVMYSNGLHLFFRQGY